MYKFIVLSTLLTTIFTHGLSLEDAAQTKLKVAMLGDDGDDSEEVVLTPGVPE